MDSFDALPHDGFNNREGWTAILRVEEWLRELNRMIPESSKRDEWIRTNCSRMRNEWSSRGPDTPVFYMKIEAFHELRKFKVTRPHVKRGANKVPVEIPDCMKEIEVPRKRARRTMPAAEVSKMLAKGINPWRTEIQAPSNEIA